MSHKILLENYEEQEETSPIQIQYGPNIVGQLIGYINEHRIYHWLHNLYQAISAPSNESKHKVKLVFIIVLCYCFVDIVALIQAQILVNNIHSRGMDEGRASGFIRNRT